MPWALGKERSNTNFLTLQNQFFVTPKLSSVFHGARYGVHEYQNIQTNTPSQMHSHSGVTNYFTSMSFSVSLFGKKSHLPSFGVNTCHFTQYFNCTCNYLHLSFRGQSNRSLVSENQKIRFAGPSNDSKRTQRKQCVT